MTDLNSVSAHLGASKVATKIIESVSVDILEKLESRSTSILGSYEYRNYLRPKIISKNKFASFDANPKKYSKIILNQHSFFGEAKLYANISKLHSNIALRINNFHRIFNLCERFLHLAIIPINIYSIILDNLDEYQSQNSECLEEKFFWYRVVINIIKFCPNSHVYVWDFSRPEISSLFFLKSILGIDASDIDPVTISRIRKASNNEIILAQKVNQILDLSSRRIEALHAIYMEDLDMIEKIDNVEVFRCEKYMNSL